MFQSIYRMNCYMLNGPISLTETLDMLLLTAYICQNLFTAESDAKLAVPCWHIISEMTNILTLVSYEHMHYFVIPYVMGCQSWRPGP